LAAVAAYVFWGVATFYWRLLSGLPALEILFHRVLWSLPVLLLTLAFSRRVRSLWQVKRRDRFRLLASSLAVMSNWGFFIWAILLERVVEASLAYYINPFLSIAFGVALFGERLSRTQWSAVALAGMGVLTMILLEGQVPWLALVIAFSFATYGAIRRGTRAPGPVVALTWEVMILYPVALVGLVVVEAAGEGSIGGGGPVTLLLVGAGLVTVIPLLLFGSAVRSIPLAWVGILQFITPTMFFLEGAFLFGEEVSRARWVGFVFVWMAVVLFLVDVTRSVRSGHPATAG
jgi:chloramphenicol-sensitive protein RarD